METRRQKVMAYVVRAQAGQRELLVFEHRHQPEAGLQVPAGTVEPGESIEAGLLREVVEETGLSAEQVRLVGKLAEAHEAELDQQRHVFELSPANPLPDRWSHTVRGAGEDAGLVFEFYWVEITAALKLAGGQERFLHRLHSREEPQG
jgi:8-oxo-dGTP pyrophosphatase MutT (NUDIX family)